MSEWSTQQARELYSIGHWAESCFDINDDGLVVAQPQSGQSIALTDAIKAAQRHGLRLPLLLRFPQVLRHRRDALHAAFAEAFAAAAVDGQYCPVYPIKVNQQAAVVDALLSGGRCGLECGSKPELIAVLARTHQAPVICNGYKDDEYIALALAARRLGIDTTIVIEKPDELQRVRRIASKLGVEPRLGVRVRLASIGTGNWQNTGGERAKFGLSAGQVMDVVNQLKAEDQLKHLQLLHFHMGSQLSNIRDIRNGLGEGLQYYTQLRALGAPLDTLDVGGGLAVDYEGSRSRGACSMNYSLAEYAHNVVNLTVERCQEADCPVPNLITEAGRAMVAHHAVLVFDITGVEHPTIKTEQQLDPADGENLFDLIRRLPNIDPREAYHEALHELQDAHDRFRLDQISLPQRAAIEDAYFHILGQIRGRLDVNRRAHRALIDEIDGKLAAKYFGNFSVFQSMPDVWGIDQVFPVMPLARLNERPQLRAVIEDLTCDSDGRINLYVDSESLEDTLAVHTTEAASGYLLGAFLVGAYQETLGDIHNLFGDTDACNVVAGSQGIDIERITRGNTNAELLEMVGFDARELHASLSRRVAAADLPEDLEQTIHRLLESGLNGYCYLRSD